MIEVGTKNFCLPCDSGTFPGDPAENDFERDWDKNVVIAKRKFNIVRLGLIEVM